MPPRRTDAKSDERTSCREYPDAARSAACERGWVRSDGTAPISVFLVECFAPASGDDATPEAARRVAEACVAFATRYLGAVLVPGDEVAFHLFAAADADAVLEASRRANLRVERVVPSTLLIAAQLERPLARASCEVGS
jgi:hypothetical protein